MTGDDGNGARTPSGRNAGPWSVEPLRAVATCAALAAVVSAAGCGARAYDPTWDCIQSAACCAELAETVPDEAALEVCFDVGEAFYAALPDDRRGALDDLASNCAGKRACEWLVCTTGGSVCVFE